MNQLTQTQQLLLNDEWFQEQSRELTGKLFEMGMSIEGTTRIVKEYTEQYGAVMEMGSKIPPSILEKEMKRIKIQFNHMVWLRNVWKNNEKRATKNP